MDENHTNNCAKPLAFEVSQPSGAKNLLGNAPLLSSVDFLQKAFLEAEERKHWQTFTSRFTRKKHKNYKEARSIILDMHLYIDKLLGILISYLLEKSLIFLKINLKSKPKDLSDAIYKIEIGRRIRLVTNLGILSSTTLVTINKINDIRNAFAHPHGENDKEFNHGEQSIFTLGGIEKIIADYDKAFDEFYQIMIPKPEPK